MPSIHPMILFFLLGAVFCFSIAYFLHQLRQKMLIVEEIKKHQEAFQWISPEASKVAWAEPEEQAGDVLCRWQDHLINKEWVVNGAKWEWVKNTKKDEWPMEMPFEEGLKWWNGVALYRRVINHPNQ